MPESKSLSAALRSLLGRLRRTHRGIRSFHQAIAEAGGIGSSVDRGYAEVPTEKIVGSVSRWQNLGSDFFYKTGQKMTQRFRRVGQAMAQGKLLPPLELYKIKPRPSIHGQAPPSEYFVVDGHHRVAMARRMGQDFLDAHVTEFTGARRVATDTSPDSEAQSAHLLRRVGLFRDAPTEDLVQLWRRLVETPVPAGALICKRGQAGDRFYIVKRGSVEVRLGTDQPGFSLYSLAAGDSFGEMSLLTGGVRSADVVALEDSMVWALERADFDSVLNQSLSLSRALNRSLAQRLVMATSVIERTELGGPQAGVDGMRFGPYRVIAQLGAGGMAVVYSAVREDGTVIALKVLPASWGDAPELRARLEREAAILRRVEHPGIIRLLDVGVVADRLGGGTFLAMEWLPDALDRMLHARYPEPLSPVAALHIARTVVEALGAVHAAGLVHHDVKPSNILLRSDGRPVVTDFGLAAAMAESAGERRLTPPNMLVGTADYLAPEEITGHTLDGRADLYAVGVVLYEMLAGFVPFAGRDPLQMLRAHCEEAVPPLPASVPPVARTIVERALQKQPADRFASASEMAESIATALTDISLT
jgi:CRP-like cAMP-binding protein